MLETDVHQLVAILLEDGFESVYDTDQNSVYGLLESDFGDIYSLYQGQAGCISSYCVFQPKIPPSATDKIQTYLDGLNKENPSGRFYVDPTLSRLVYEVIYQLPEKADSWSLDLFCRYSYFPLKSQRQMLYWLITGKMVKKQNEEIITSR